MPSTLLNYIVKIDESLEENQPRYIHDYDEEIPLEIEL